jgi:hypothetical protein
MGYTPQGHHEEEHTMADEEASGDGALPELIQEIVGPEGMAVMAEIARDPVAFLNTPHLPEDAGAYAEGLAAILQRIPPGWGRWIGCSRGWYPLLIETDQKLAALDPAYQVHQVKEKFGGLRYYFQFVTAGADHRAGSAIESAVERLSYTICELCGQPGQCRDGGWLQTLCDEHANGRPTAKGWGT